MTIEHSLILVARCLDHNKKPVGSDRILVLSNQHFYLLTLRAARYCKHHIIRVTPDELLYGLPPKKWGIIGARLQAQKGAKK